MPRSFGLPTGEPVYRVTRTAQHWPGLPFPKACSVQDQGLVSVSTVTRGVRDVSKGFQQLLARGQSLSSPGTPLTP